MRGELTRSTLVALLAVSAGCRLPGTDGPVPRSLAASRQLSQQGVAAIEQRQWDRAEDLLSRAVNTCPSNSDARRAYSEALWNRGHREEALAQLQEATRLDPRDATLRVRMAEMHLALGRIDRAMKSAQEAIDLDSRLPSAWAVRARIHRAAGDLAQALADFHRALGHQPDDRAIQWELAELYRELDQPQRALIVLQALAESYSPGEEPQSVLYAQGLALLELGRAEDAAQTLSAAAGRGISNPEVLYQLAEAQWQAGRGALALDAAQRSLDLDPEYTPSRRLVDRIRLAQQSVGTAGPY